MLHLDAVFNVCSFHHHLATMFSVSYATMQVDLNQ